MPHKASADTGAGVQVRYNKSLRSQKPVTLHANYHANKAKRLEAAEQFWVDGDDTALMALPEGS